MKAPPTQANLLLVGLADVWARRCRESRGVEPDLDTFLLYSPAGNYWGQLRSLIRTRSGTTKKPDRRLDDLIEKGFALLEQIPGNQQVLKDWSEFQARLPAPSGKTPSFRWGMKAITCPSSRGLPVRSNPHHY